MPQLKALMPNWRNLLILSHRWLGIVGWVLVVAWFASGIAMMYVRMPTLEPEEVLARAEPLDLSTVTVPPGTAAARAGVRLSSVSIFMRDGRPIYRFAGRESLLVFADTGDEYTGAGEAEALAAARTYMPAWQGGLRYDSYLTEPDQWTLQTPLPVHRLAVDDDADTHYYVSAATGDVVLRTTMRERFWAYLGPVMHWIYFTPLRRNGAMWADIVIWSAVFGCVLALSGLVWGAMRLSPMRRFHVQGRATYSPYTGMIKWHHYAGLVCGLFALTWAYSGLLSMQPFGWFARTTPSPVQLTAAMGGPLRTEPLTLESLRAALATFQTEFAPREIQVHQVLGTPYWVSDIAPDIREVGPWLNAGMRPRAARPALERRYVSAVSPDHIVDRFDPADMELIAQELMDDASIADMTWLNAYDAYYYDPRGGRALPVLRVQYDDSERTWVYLDPSRGALVAQSDRVGRRVRWLYQGLHSLDFPFLYFKRPLWDAVVLALSLGGLAITVTSAWPACVDCAGMPAGSSGGVRTVKTRHNARS